MTPRLPLALLMLCLALAVTAEESVKPSDQIVEELKVPMRGISFQPKEPPPEPSLELDATEGQVAGVSNLTIPFEFNSDALSASATTQLDELSAALQAPALEHLSFRIVGHTDSVGSEAYNQELSTRRAERVQQYLLDSGAVDAARLRALGKGESAPLDPADPTAAMNRRVEIISVMP